MYQLYVQVNFLAVRELGDKPFWMVLLRVLRQVCCKCVAVCCSVLQMCCNVLQCVAVCWMVLLRVVQQACCKCGEL